MAIKPLVDVFYALLGGVWGVLKELLVCSWHGHSVPSSRDLRPGTAIPCGRCQARLIWLGYKHGWRRA